MRTRTSGTDPAPEEAEEKSKRKAATGLSSWYQEQRGQWVACPRDLSRYPKSKSEPRDRIRSGHTHMVIRSSCLWTKKTPDAWREWCQHCPYSRFVVTLSAMDADFTWLDDLMGQINLLYQDQFELVPGGLWFAHRQIDNVQKHGRVIQVSYRVVFPDEADPRSRRLPYEEGLALMDLIEAAAAAAEARPGLVPTMTKGKHDFCDWYVMPDGHGEIRIYLEAPPE